ncbi:MAG TPA: D-alanine--D-alanine ligase [Nitrospirae bacterium]|nr:D-alanine--D-alanine ligase B [bacterium BMS3Abin10]GBE40028.1 D-alanine--D-alanine ligase B [bacterium BMS3Bbin08]HDH50037.1 D-alanine--D-alanine ligase [Nitrospirota bacterium]HDK16717.1 D-alanine--D-alanine ligase [Nitrospirota bacterium]HDK82279.1 D-alanine--D-alanine ligase [Nitrospirota bacterium]
MTKGPVTAKKTGILMGGVSAERDVSVRSGLAIYQALQELGYNCAVIDVGKDIVNVLKKEKVRFAFLALHGGMGENGAIQGMLEVLGIPYTGSGVLASALAMDKEVSKKVLAYHGLPVVPFAVVSRPAKGKSKKAVAEPALPEIDFPLPWVVKPAAEGSSIGVSIIKDKAMLAATIEKTFSHGRRVIIEKFIGGKEVHIGILGSRALGGVEVRPTLEFYNYEAKYTSGLTEYIIPPQIEEPLYEKLRDMAMQAHSALGCSGATRVDLKLDESSNPYVLEVNTLPGMTATSLLPKIAKSAGLSFKDLIEEIIRIAVKEA